MAHDPILQLRGFKALAQATGEHVWEDRAFSTLAEMIERATLKVPGHPPLTIVQISDLQKASTLRLQPSSHGACPVRRLRRPRALTWAAGGPTPRPTASSVGARCSTRRSPYAAPILSKPRLRWLPEPRLILVSRDLDTTLEPAYVGEVLAYARPGDPFSLHKAALVLRGVVPTDADP